MPREEGIAASGVITEILENGVYLAELPNGKIVTAFPGKSVRLGSKESFQAGDRVALKMTPYDFSKAEITGRENF